MVRQRVRIRFRKQGDLRLIGHRDLARSLERLFRRSGLPLGMSQGFHPKPRMSFPSALALGIEGLDEVMELELVERLDPDEMLRRLRQNTVPGIEFQSVQMLAPGTRKARVRSLTYELPVPAERRTEVAERAARFMAECSCRIRRAGGGEPVDVRASLEELTVRKDVLRMRLRCICGPNAGPRDVLDALGLADLERGQRHLRRTSVELQP